MRSLSAGSQTLQARPWSACLRRGGGCNTRWRGFGWLSSRCGRRRRRLRDRWRINQKSADQRSQLISWFLVVFVGLVSRPCVAPKRLLDDFGARQKTVGEEDTFCAD